MFSNRDDINSADRNGDPIDELMKAFKRNVMLEVRVAMPATVIEYNPATQMAMVLPHIQPVRALPDGGEQVLAPQPISNVPVAFPSTDDGFLTFPIKKGCYGQLVVNDRSIDRWLEDGKPQDPKMSWTHNLTDATFYPGMRPKSHVLPPVDQNNTVLEGPGIKLGYNAERGLARFDDPSKASDPLIAWAQIMETIANTVAPKTFIEFANDFQTLVAPMIGRISEASTKSKSE